MSATSVGVVPSGVCLQSKGKADMVRVWVAGKTVWFPCYIGSYLSAYRVGVHDEVLYKSTFFTSLLFLKAAYKASYGGQTKCRYQKGRNTTIQVRRKVSETEEARKI